MLASHRFPKSGATDALNGWNPLRRGERPKPRARVAAGPFPAEVGSAAPYTGIYVPTVGKPETTDRNSLKYPFFVQIAKVGFAGSAACPIALSHDCSSGELISDVNMPIEAALLRSPSTADALGWTIRLAYGSLPFRHSRRLTNVY